MEELKLNGINELERQLKQFCELTDIFLKLKDPSCEYNKTKYVLVFPQDKSYNKVLISAYLIIESGFYEHEIWLTNEAIENSVSFTLFLESKLFNGREK